VLDADVEYCIVVMCDDALAALGIAELGKFDATNQVWVTSQPYTVGVLLSSSNNSTWTPHQDKDLTFKLIAAEFSQTNTMVGSVATKEVALPDVSVTNADHLIVLAAVERPSSDTDIVFVVTVGANAYTVREGQRFTLPATFTGLVSWKAVITGTATETPKLYKDIQLVSATRLNSGDYVSRQIKAGTGSTITVYYELFNPGLSTVTAFAENGAAWTAIPIVLGDNLGEGWTDVKRQLTGFNQANTRIKLSLNGSATERPIVRNFRVVIT
jgi:hypothetical protein